MQKRQSKLVVKDAAGQLIQLLPEVQVDSSVNANSDFPVSGAAVAEAIQNAETSLSTDYVGATSSANGVHGLVPAAPSADREKFLKGDGTWAEVNTEKEVGYSTTEPTSQSTASLDNESFVFYETESFGGDGAWDASISGNAATADSVNHAMTLTVDGGTLEGLTKYSFNGSVAKEVNLVAGNGVTLTPTYGTVTISTETYPAYQGATENANGVEGLVPSALSEEKDRFLKGDGTWASANIGLSLEHVPAGTTTVSVPYSPEAAEMGVSNDDESFQLKTSISIDNETVYNENKTHPVGNIPLDCSSLNINDNSVINISFKATSGGYDFWLRYTLEANFNELVSAGTEGMPLTEDTSNSEGYSPLPENKEFRVSLTDEGNGQYSLHPFIAENQSVPEKDNLVVEQPDGTTTNVDMGPLLNSVSIGGRIEERVVEVEGTIEYLQFSDGEEEPTAFPVSDASGMMYGGFIDSSKNQITNESISLIVDGNTATFEFEETLPSFIRPLFLVVNGEESNSSNPRFFLIGLDEQNQEESQGISLEDALSASNGIELHAYDIINGHPVLADVDPIYLYVEKTSDSPFTLQFKLAKKQQKINPILHLEKSDNNDIDLSPLTNDLLTNAELSYNVQEPQVHSNDNNYSIRIDYYDENNTFISSQSYDRNSNFDSMDNDNIEITIPQNCKYFNITYDESVEGSNKNFAVYNANNIDVSNIRANYVVSSTDPEIETRI